jgi:preprotein translocase subunit SecG
MTTVLILIHLMVVLAMIGLILLQRSEGGALGIGGSAGGFLTGRSAGNVLSHTTAWLAGAFFITSITLTILARIESRPSDIFDAVPVETTTETPAAPEQPVGPPASAEDVLKGLGGSAETPAPGTPPASSGGTSGGGQPTGNATPPGGTPAPSTGSQPVTPSPAAPTTNTP